MMRLSNKCFLTLALGAVFVIGPAACSNPEPEVVTIPEPEDKGEEILLSMMMEQPAARSTAAEFLPDLTGKTIYWGMTTGSAGSETQKKGSTALVCSSNNPTVATGFYQAEGEEVTYNYYVSNIPFSISNGRVSANVSNTTDVVVGRESNSGTHPTIVMQHIFSRLLSVSVTASTSNGYYLSGQPQFQIRKAVTNSTTGSAGTYNFSTGIWTATSGLGSYEDVVEDMYLIPGDYQLKVRYSLVKEDWHADFEKSVTISLQGGKKMIFSGTLPYGPGAQGLVFTTQTYDWDENVYQVQEES